MKGAQAGYGPVQAPRHLGIAVWQWEAALRRGLIPAADTDGRWSAALIDDAAVRLAEILKEVGDFPPVGARRAAGLLTERSGLDVHAADVGELVRRELLVAVSWYKEHALYDTRDLLRLADDQAVLIAELAAERQAWVLASLHPHDAARLLGWHRGELDRGLAALGVTPGRFGRIPKAAVDELLADEELAGEIRGARLIGPDQAAELLEIRRADFNYCVAAGWVAPVTHADSRISRRRWISVPLYRARDVEALRDLPGVDWEAVRSVRPGEPSPLREYAALPIARAVLVRGFAADLAGRHQIEAAASYDDALDQWTLCWEPGPDGQPDRAAVREALAAGRDLAPHLDSITLQDVLPAAGRRWAPLRGSGMCPGCGVQPGQEHASTCGAGEKP